ncbi:YifB family Mg chelatase-like AAA ATPase [Lachnoanaerobaculum umeaense]|uniref:ATP-binding protein n=1 Tax=Lachnoanaerobaculum umeaense TaxID=617123 RepID=A0A385PZK1_9FIRM|nr:YifB family Mg chelatase-like AAA ATPase [Lachnoanaerobaculum umeaense]AYA99601.1 ATP-binding protein [Lachnoanaerobaculum umeaense]PZW96461.1 magnesium chelatase family protein [Lachnoanaerobaculum umeaense]
MLSKINTAGLLGINAFHVCCETDIGDGLPGIILIGSLSGEVKEAADRVKTAIKNSKISFYPRKIVINLSPAEIKKEGCGYDLPIAISILEALGVIKSDILSKSMFVGELSLSGAILPIKGILPIVIFAKEMGFENIFLPYDNLAEANIVSDIKNFGIKNLKDLIEILNNKKIYSENISTQIPMKKEYSDFSDVNGQILLKRAVQIAVAGRHNILFIGPAGTGKSMIAQRIPGIMPNMTDEEALEVSKIYSVCGLLNSKEPILKIRPYRSPHHTVSPQALSGGGRVPKPGEISLAHKGVLFLDELAEFKMNTIEVLRQPMENKIVSISRVNASIDYPADFMLVAATNPCKCGYYPDRNKCNCNEVQVRKYLSRISKPLLDRIDITVETSIIRYDELKGDFNNTSSNEIKKYIEKVRQIQLSRYSNYNFSYNSEIPPSLINTFCKLKEQDDIFLSNLYEMKKMSVRGLHKILKVARTVADFNEHIDIEHDDICEAISYRSLEDKYW